MSPAKLFSNCALRFAAKRVQAFCILTKEKENRNKKTQRPSFKITSCHSKEEHTQTTSVNNLYILKQHREDCFGLSLNEQIFLI